MYEFPQYLSVGALSFLTLHLLHLYLSASTTFHFTLLMLTRSSLLQCTTSPIRSFTHSTPLTDLFPTTLQNKNMSCEPRSCTTTAAPLRPYAQQSGTAETVEGVPLFFGALPPTEAQRIANGHVAEVLTTPSDASPDTPPHAANTMTVASVRSRNPFRRNFGPAERAALREELIGAPMDRSASTGEKVGVVVRDTALFPLRLVRFAVALPFRAVYVAHDCVSHAVSSNKK